MSAKLILIIVGIVVVILGVAQLGSSPRGSPNRGFRMSNFGVNIGVARPPGSIVTRRPFFPRGNFSQPNGPNQQSGSSQSNGGADWIGLATAVVGLLTALVGLFNEKRA
jgi:hypothetical protein